METCYVLILTETEVKLILYWTEGQLTDIRRTQKNLYQIPDHLRPDKVIQLLENLKAKLDDSLER